MDVASLLYLTGFLWSFMAPMNAVLIGLVWRPRPSRLWLPLAVYGVALCWSFVSSNQGNAERVCYFVGLVGAFGLARIMPHATIRKGLTVMGTLLAVLVLAESLARWARPEWLGNPNLVATWLLLVPGFGLLPIVGVLATQSRSAIVGLLVAITARFRTRLNVLILVIGLPLAVVSLYLLRPATITDRLETWRDACLLFLSRPLTGYGAGSFALVSQSWHKHADNALLTVAAEQGLVGLAACGWLVVTVVKMARRSTSPSRWVLLALAVQNLFDDTIFFPWSAILVGLNLGMLEANDDQEARQELHPVQPHGQTGSGSPSVSPGG